MSQPNFKWQTGAFFVSLFLFLSTLIVIDKLGISDVYAKAATIFYGALLILLPIYNGAAIRSAKFFFSDRSLSSGINALALLPCVALPFIVVFGGYFFLVKTELLVLFSIAGSAAIALFTLLIARPFRQSGATSLANFQINRFGTHHVARLSSIVHLIAGACLLIASIHIVSQLISWHFAITPFFANLIACIAIIITACFGGVASTARQAALAAFCLLIALNIPIAFESYEQTGFPAGILSFSSNAFSRYLEIETQLIEGNFEILKNSVSFISPTKEWTNSSWILASLILVFGIFSSPVLLQQFSMSTSPERASNAGQKALLLFGFLILSIFALLSFLKLSLYQTLLGISSGEVRQDAVFLYQSIGGYLDKTPLVTICEKFVKTPQDVIAACGGDPNYVVSLSEINFNGQFLLAASSNLMSHPAAFHAFLVLALCIFIIAYCAHTVLSVALNLVSAFFSTTKNHLASSEMFLTRLTVVICFIVLFQISLLNQFDPVQLILFGLGMYVACLLPVLISMFYWKKTSSISSICSISIGLIASLTMFILANFGSDFKLGTGDELNITLLGMHIEASLSPILILPISALVHIFCNLVWPAKAESDQLNFVDKIFDEDENVTIARNRL